MFILSLFKILPVVLQIYDLPDIVIAAKYYNFTCSTADLKVQCLLSMVKYSYSNDL